jgi:malate dehydrogenase (oxaloacetate-decarboxylating)(NADP+)
MKNPMIRVTEEESLQLHAEGRPGKIEIVATKPLTTQRDLSLAYSPGVAFPCLKIHENPNAAYDYTAKGNMVAVISNGTAVLGLGNLGALASKPVMEGKAVLFKRFADIDAIDIEISTEDVDAFVNSVRYLGASWGGINLEDIKAPECFMIEEKLKDLMDIPIFHDDQHGTAIIALAGMLNALSLTSRTLQNIKIVVNGAGAAGIACLDLMRSMGLPLKNIILCDTKGVIYKGRTEGMNQWKSTYASDTKTRTLAEALVGADVFLGLSSKGAVTQDMVKTMAPHPIIFAMANPDPEISPEDIKAVRNDAIIATGRSDYPNQVNNVLGFPYIFRGALDVRASTINNEMKIAAAQALADLARQEVPEEVGHAYPGRHLRYGPEYIIPVPFDPRLISVVASAVAEAAMKTGVAKKQITDLKAYRRSLSARLDTTFASLQMIFEHVRKQPRTVVFTEGEEEQVIRAAISYCQEGYGEAILLGFIDKIEQTIKEHNMILPKGVKIHDVKSDKSREYYIDYLYNRLQRKGALHRDCRRYVNHDRNVFAACMVANREAHAMVSGITRNYTKTLGAIMRVLDPKPGAQIFGLSLIVSRDKTVFVADTSVHDAPTAEQLADIAVQSAAKVKRIGYEPRVAFVSYSNFGSNSSLISEKMKLAVKILEKRGVDFEFDGEMSPDVALNEDFAKVYPFCRLKGPANILIMPDLHSAQLTTKLVKQLGSCTVIGPLLQGLDKPAQVVHMGATATDIMNAAVLAAHDALHG